MPIDSLIVSVCVVAMFVVFAAVLAWGDMQTQMVRDPDLSQPQLYGLLAGRVESAGVVKERLNKLDVSSEHAKATQACLPIGPSCC